MLLQKESHFVWNCALFIFNIFLLTVWFRYCSVVVDDFVDFMMNMEITQFNIKVRPEVQIMLDNR